MNTADLVREARAIIPPVGASRAICVVDDGLKHRAAFLVHGRIRSAPVGPAFDRPRDACRLVDLLNGEVPRPGQEGLTGRDVPASRAFPDQTEAPDPRQDASSVCAGCGNPFPLGRRGQRRLTCSPACRERVRYRRAAAAGGADEAAQVHNLTPSRSPEAEAPSPRAVAGEKRPLAPARGDRSGPTSRGPTGASPSLGL